MDISPLMKSPDRLLMEIGFTGAHYGLYKPVMAIAAHLGKNETTRPASVLMLGVLDIALRNYVGARTIFQAVIDNPRYENFHQEAGVFLAIVDKLSPNTQNK